MDAVLLILQRLDFLELIEGYLYFRVAWALFRLFF